MEVPTESPLSEEIEAACINRDLKIPPITQFDGTTDPNDFLNIFDGRMSFYGHSDIARCRFFYTCHQGTALKWFNNLPARSIQSWQELKTKFRGRFSSNKRGEKITASLMTVRQKENETLRDFLARFRVEVAEIPNLIDELAINYLAARIDKSRHGQFFEKNPRSLQAAMQILEHRLTLQEAVSSIQSPTPPIPKWNRSSASTQWVETTRWESRKIESPTLSSGPEKTGDLPARSTRQWPRSLE